MKKQLLSLLFLFLSNNIFSHNQDTQYPLTNALWIFMQDTDLEIKRKISLLDSIVRGAVTISNRNAVFHDIFDPSIKYEEDIATLNDFIEKLKPSDAGCCYHMKLLKEVQYAQLQGGQPYLNALQKLFSPDGIFEMVLQRFFLIIVNCPSPEAYYNNRQRKEMLTTLYNRDKDVFIELYGNVSVDEALEMIGKRITTVYNLRQAIIASNPEAIKTACQELITHESALLIQEFKGFEEDINKLENS